MSSAILYIGPSGAGKTTAARTLNPETTFIIKCVRKDLPWKGSQKQYTVWDATKNPDGNCAITSNSKEVVGWLTYINKNRPKITDIVIDDNTFLSSLELLRRTKETTWDKFSDIANNFIDLANISSSLRDDLIVHILHHTISEGDGIIEDKHFRAQSYGKLIDEKLGSIEAQFSIVLRVAKEKNNDNIKYVFYTKDANSTCKTPLGMFEDSEIDNCMKTVSDTVRKYYTED